MEKIIKKQDGKFKKEISPVEEAGVTASDLMEILIKKGILTEADLN